MVSAIDSLEFRLLCIVQLLAATLFFAWMMVKRCRQMRRAKRPECRTDHLWLRVLSVLKSLIGQKRLPANGYLYRGFLHLFIFCSFIVLLTDTFFFVLNAVLSALGCESIALPRCYKSFADTARLLCLAGVGMAYVNRLILRPKNLPLTRDGLITLGFITCHMLLELLEGAFAFALATDSKGTWFTSGVGALLPASEFAYKLLWWGHLECLLCFVCYIPFSKHLHIFLAPFNLLFADLSPKGRLRKLDLDSAESEENPHFGAQKIEDLSWKQVLDAFSCAQCGRCIDVCPAARSGASLKPFDLFRQLRLMAQNETSLDFFTDDKPLISLDALWDCTTCRACMTVCPVRNEHVPLLVDLRRYRTLTLGDVGPGATNALKQMERKSNPWGMSKRDREMGLEDVPRWNRSQPQDFLLFLGCNAAFDERGQKSARALISILNACHVSYGVLGNTERCCGETARRLGDEYLFQNMASALIGELEKQSVTRVLTVCPHCFNTLKNEYPDFGAHFEVIHSTELLADLLKNGKLQLNSRQEKSQIRVAYHDPCYLGRYNEIYEAPRMLLRACSQIELVESKFARQNAFCCGGGGGQMWMENEQRPNRERYADLQQTHADVIVVNCGYCSTMLSDAAAASESPLPIRDLTELLAEHLCQFEDKNV